MSIAYIDGPFWDSSVVWIGPRPYVPQKKWGAFPESIISQLWSQDRYQHSSTSQCFPKPSFQRTFANSIAKFERQLPLRKITAVQ